LGEDDSEDTKEKETFNMEGVEKIENEENDWVTWNVLVF
jgi:hypothetical protein